MATWYVDFSSGSGVNAGTSQGAAKKTLAQAVALASAGDRIEVYGIFRPIYLDGSAAFNALTFPTLTSVSDLTFNFSDICDAADMVSFSILSFSLYSICLVPRFDTITNNRR